MAEHDEPRNPYAVGAPHPPPEPADPPRRAGRERRPSDPPASDTEEDRDSSGRRDPDRPGGRKPVDPDRLARRRSFSLVLLSGLALLTAAQIPPLGLALGVAAVVLAIRGREDARRSPSGSTVRALAIGGGVVAVVIGLLLSTVMVVLRTELSAYQECSAGAQTRVAQQRCDDALVEDLPGWLEAVPWS